MAITSDQKPIKIEGNSLKARFNKVIDKLGIIVVLIFLVILMTFLTDKFLTPMNLTNVVRQISFIALIAIGVTSIIITTGIDLSSGSVVGLTSVVVASAAHPGQFPLFVTILIGLSVGLADCLCQVAPIYRNHGHIYNSPRIGAALQQWPASQ
jgi:ribose/xylose/arabinose/galactoside ABC-type transport system permease subunit